MLLGLKDSFHLSVKVVIKIFNHLDALKIVLDTLSTALLLERLDLLPKLVRDFPCDSQALKTGREAHLLKEFLELLVAGLVLAELNLNNLL